MSDYHRFFKQLKVTDHKVGQALEQLAVEKGLPADHPFVLLLQGMVRCGGHDFFMETLCYRAHFAADFQDEDQTDFAAFC